MVKKEEKTTPTYLEKLELIEKTIKEGDKGLVIDVQPIKNTAYFGVLSSYGEKDGISITVKINSPEGTTFTQWYNLVDTPRGLEKSNIFAFKRKYGKYPMKGVEVDVKLDENGFYVIVL